MKTKSILMSGLVFAVLGASGACDVEEGTGESLDEFEIAERMWEHVEGYRSWTAVEGAGGQTIFSEANNGLDVHSASPNSIYVVEPGMPNDAIHAAIRVEETPGYLWVGYGADGDVLDSQWVRDEHADVNMRAAVGTHDGNIECSACHASVANNCIGCHLRPGYEPISPLED